MERPAKDVIAIGASAGGVEALRALLPLFRADLDAAVIVVLHRALSPLDYLPEVLGIGAHVPVRAAIAGERLCRGNVYIAPAQVLMTIARGRIALGAATLLASRTGIDVLFRSVAEGYGTRAVGIVLSGMLRDGTAGLRDVRSHGGLTIVQDPGQAMQTSMPMTAMHEGRVHYCVNASDIAEIASTHLDRRTAALPSRPRVLLAASDVVDARSLEERLPELGYDVIDSVTSGEDALKVASRELPDIVLMDVRLAGVMPGSAAARLIYERFGIPVVYLTAYVDGQTLTAVKRSASYGFIVKPCLIAQIHATLELALDRRREERLREHVPARRKQR